MVINDLISTFDNKSFYAPPIQNSWIIFIFEMEEGPEISQNANLNKQAYTKKWIESILSTKIEDDDFNKWIQNGDIVYKVVEYIVNK